MTVKLNTTDYPNIDRQDNGKWPNIPYGSLTQIRCHAIAAGATTHPTANITDSDLSFVVESTDGYPSTPFTIQIEDERLRVTNINTTTNTFTVTRAYDNTLAAAHGKYRTIYEVKTEYVYLASDKAVEAINGVYIIDNKQDVAGDSRITVYTGYDGDDLAGYEGKAVVKFEADAYIGAQFNLDDPFNKESGEAVAGTVNAKSDPELDDGLSATYKELMSGQIAWIDYALDAGIIIREEYTAVIYNPSETDSAKITMVATDQNNNMMALKYLELAPEEGITAVLTQGGGNWDDVFKVVCQIGTIQVSSMSKTVTKRIEKFTYDESLATVSTPKEIEYYNDNALIKWVKWNNTLDGTNTVIKETVTANITLADTGSVRLVSTSNINNNYGSKPFIDLPAGSHFLTLEYYTDNGGGFSKVVSINGDNPTVQDISKTTYYKNELTESNRYRDSQTSSARIVVGENVYVDMDGIVDETGDYGGAGNLITIPDWVDKFHLIEILGFTAGEIDATSFTAAGSSYASAIAGGYKLAFLWDGEPITEFAAESRSTINYEDGKWYLNYLPDAAPASLKTIDKDELIEKTMFNFDKMSRLKIENDLNARFKRDYKNGGWLGTSEVDDSGSITKYGNYPGYYKFKFIRLQAMADDVLDHILLQKKIPLMTLRFGAFYDHFNLNVGDTFAITNDGLFDTSKKWYIENKIRNKDTLKLIAKEWW